YSPRGDRIATASMDGTVCVWRGDGAGEPRVFRAPVEKRGSIDVQFDPEGRRISIVHQESKTGWVWTIDSPREPMALEGHETRINTAEWSPEGSRLATASYDGTARIWDIAGGTAPVVLRGHEGPVGRAVWHRDGKRIVTTSGDKTARIWNADGSGEP